jgi:uncharacterized membrane protein (DUF106 family)
LFFSKELKVTRDSANQKVKEAERKVDQQLQQLQQQEQKRALQEVIEGM